MMQVGITDPTKIERTSRNPPTRRWRTVHATEVLVQELPVLFGDRRDVLVRPRGRAKKSRRSRSLSNVDARSPSSRPTSSV